MEPVQQTYTYSYNDQAWGDLLTSYRGIPITYDEIGNPLSYYNGSSYTFTWKDGRRLATATKGSYTLSFEYDDNGIRTSKTVNGEKHIYYLSGLQIIAEEWENNLCVYLYDADGSPIGMQYRSYGMTENTFETYWFEKNLQGDVVAVYNMSGVKIRAYTYDAWGNVKETVYSSSGMNYYASFNPFKYRGYYMDSETGFYYLQSRYYDPMIGRFINSDGMIGSGGFLGYNMFAYCANSPVIYVDPCGMCKHNNIVGEDCVICTSTKLNHELAGITENEVEPDAYFYEYEDDGTAFSIAMAITSNASGGFLALLSKITQKGMSSVARPNNIGLGTFIATQEAEIASVDVAFKKAGVIVGVAFVAVDVFVGIDQNVQNGASAGKILWDAGVDLACSGVTLWASLELGGIVGSVVCPGVGTVVGMIVGLGGYILLDVATYGSGNTARGHLKSIIQ